MVHSPAGRDVPSPGRPCIFEEFEDPVFAALETSLCLSPESLKSRLHGARFCVRQGHRHFRNEFGLEL